MKFRLVELTKLRGIAQIPLIVGLLLMAIAIPVATRLSQQEQDTRQLAATCPVSAGGSCSGSDAICCGSQMFACAGGTWTMVQSCSAGCKTDRSGCNASCAYSFTDCGACGSGCAANEKRCYVTNTDCTKEWKCLDFSSQCVVNPTTPPSEDCGSHPNHSSWCEGNTRKWCNFGNTGSENCNYGCQTNSSTWAVCKPAPTSPPNQPTSIPFCSPNSLRCREELNGGKGAQERCNPLGTGWDIIMNCVTGCNGNLCDTYVTNTPVPVKKYRCTMTNTCVEDPNGNFSGLAACENMCFTTSPVPTVIPTTGIVSGKCTEADWSSGVTKCSSDGQIYKCMRETRTSPYIYYWYMDRSCLGYGCNATTLACNPSPTPGGTGGLGTLCTESDWRNNVKKCVDGQIYKCMVEKRSSPWVYYWYMDSSCFGYGCNASTLVCNPSPTPVLTTKCCCSSTSSSVCNWYSVPVTGGCSSLASLLRNANDTECKTPKPTSADASCVSSGGKCIGNYPCDLGYEPSSKECVSGVCCEQASSTASCVSSGGKCIGNYPCDLGYEPSSKECVSGVCCEQASSTASCVSSGGKCIGNYPCDLGYEPSSKECVSGVCCVLSSTLVPKPTIPYNPGATIIPNITPQPTIQVTPVPTSPNAPPPAPTNAPGSVPVNCSYTSLQARVQKNSTVDWQTQLVIQKGEKVNLGCMYNGSGQLANNVKIVAGIGSETYEFTDNLVEQWEAPKNGNYTIWCVTTDSNCGSLVSKDNATLSVGSACKECPSDFHCFGPADDKVDYGYRWFADGYVQEGWVTKVPNNYCDEVNIIKPQWLGKGRGDANCDGVLDIADTAVWRHEYADISKGDEIVRDNWEADFTGPGGVCDGIVDIGDVSLWRANFTKYFTNY